MAVAEGVDPLDEAEAEAVGALLASVAGGLDCSVVSFASGGRWIDVVLDARPGFGLPRAMTSLKAVTSRRIAGARRGVSGIWANGYAAVTLGENVDPEKTAEELLREFKNRED
jgi:hypothetical protein